MNTNGRTDRQTDIHLFVISVRNSFEYHTSFSWKHNVTLLNKVSQLTLGDMRELKRLEKPFSAELNSFTIALYSQLLKTRSLASSTMILLSFNALFARDVPTNRHRWYWPFFQYRYRWKTGRSHLYFYSFFRFIFGINECLIIKNIFTVNFIFKLHLNSVCTHLDKLM